MALLAGAKAQGRREARLELRLLRGHLAAPGSPPPLVAARGDLACTPPAGHMHSRVLQLGIV